MDEIPWDPLFAHGMMTRALDQAERAAGDGEVPVGAVLVDPQGAIIATARNQTIARNDPTAHAEILVLREAGRRLGNYRLLNTTLYVTIEPCVMCMGAIVHARISHVIFGAYDPKWGGAGSLYNLAADAGLNHGVQVTGGVMEERCKKLIRNFFQMRRAEKKRMGRSFGRNEI